jgi:signal transduction histidine kinase
LLDRQGFRLETAVPEDLPEVRADPDALGQALANLLGNAMKYSGAARDIRLEAARSGSQAAIRVIDYGVGIPAAEQARIFDSFYRARLPENQSIQGAGLGLTLVRHVMQGHGGEVRVESAPGRGSTFTLLLPSCANEEIV